MSLYPGCQLTLSPHCWLIGSAPCHPQLPVQLRLTSWLMIHHSDLKRNKTHWHSSRKLKVPRIMLLSSPLWWVLGTNFPLSGPGEHDSEEFGSQVAVPSHPYPLVKTGVWLIINWYSQNEHAKLQITLKKALNLKKQGIHVHNILGLIQSVLEHDWHKHHCV